MSDVREAVGDFALAAVGASAFALMLLFGIFFIQDAPNQLALAKKTVTQLAADNAQTIERLNVENAKIVEQLKGQIANLQSKLDDKEVLRLEHNEQIRLREARTNAIATLIAGANQIAKTFEEKDDKDAIQSQYRSWEQNALTMLASNEFGVSYLSQFGSARGTAYSLVNHSMEGNGWYSLLQGKLIVLNSFLTELRKQ